MAEVALMQVSISSTLFKELVLLGYSNVPVLQGEYNCPPPIPLELQSIVL